MTSIVLTLIDLATQLSDDALDRAVNEADRLDLIDPERLREALDASPRRPGLRRLRTLLDDRTFTLTDSVLERRFLKIVGEADLPRPLTQQHLNGFRVDFHWPQLNLVVETDGLRYHRTPQQQAQALVRDQAHTAAGTTPLRFSHAQVAKEGAYVRKTLAAVSKRAERISS